MTLVRWLGATMGGGGGGGAGTVTAGGTAGTGGTVTGITSRVRGHGQVCERHGHTETCLHRKPVAAQSFTFVRLRLRASAHWENVSVHARLTTGRDHDNTTTARVHIH